MKQIINHFNRRIRIAKKKRKRKDKEKLRLTKEHFKFLQPDPPNFYEALKCALSHPLVFFRSGIRGAYHVSVPPVTDPAYAQLLDQPLYSYLWNYYQQKNRLHSVKWMGIPTLKVIFDLWVYQEILFQQKPDIVIEIGSHYGGSTLFLAQMLDLIGHGQVISIEIHNQNFLGQHARVIEIEGDCSSPKVLDKVRELIRGKSVMVIHDGDHREFAALRDLELYGPMVSKGHYFIMEDGIYDLYNPKRGRINPEQQGPLKAIREFLKKYPGLFTIDTNSERFILTSNPYGYLLKTGEL